MNISDNHCPPFQQGQTIDTRWQWNATVGPLIDRPGRVGDWGYTNTEYAPCHSSDPPSLVNNYISSGLGLYEYMTFCEDVGMEAIMAVWSGYALSGESVAQADLQPYIQQAIDQVRSSDIICEASDMRRLAHCDRADEFRG